MIRTGKSEPSTFSNSSALPPRPQWAGSKARAASLSAGQRDLETRSATSLISRIGLTGTEIRCSSPTASRAAMNSPKLAYIAAHFNPSRS